MSSRMWTYLRVALTSSGLFRAPPRAVQKEGRHCLIGQKVHFSFLQPQRIAFAFRSPGRSGLATTLASGKASGVWRQLLSYVGPLYFVVAQIENLRVLI